MKIFSLLFTAIALIAAPVIAQTTSDEYETLYLKSPVYVKTMEELNSDYAKQKFPPVHLAFPKVTQPPTAFLTSNRALFNSLQSLGAMGGWFDKERLRSLTYSITDDFDISEEEAQVVELLKNQTPFTFSFIPTENFNPRPVELAPRLDAANLEALKTLQENGVVLKTHEVMNLKLLRAEKFGDWVELYFRGGQDSQIALAAMRRRFIVTTVHRHQKYNPVIFVIGDYYQWINRPPSYCQSNRHQKGGLRRPKSYRCGIRRVRPQSHNRHFYSPSQRRLI